MKKTLALISMLMISRLIVAQEAERLIRKGNELYKQEQYTEAELVYTEALTKAPDNDLAKFNQANTLYKQNKTEEALKVLDDLAFKSTDASIKARAYYNKGAILSGQKKLEESIEAYKNALRHDPADTEARENLQKALQELKKKNPQKKDDKKQQQKQKQKQPQPQPKMSQKEAEQRLQMLEQKEKEVQQRLQKEKAKQGGGQTKDW